VHIFDEVWTGFLHQSSSSSSNQSNADNLSNVRHEASRHFRNKKMEYLKPKTDELEINSKIKNFRLVQGHH
jgi:hypothetical protein